MSIRSGGIHKFKPLTFSITDLQASPAKHSSAWMASGTISLSCSCQKQTLFNEEGSWSPIYEFILIKNNLPKQALVTSLCSHLSQSCSPQSFFCLHMQITLAYDIALLDHDNSMIIILIKSKTISMIISFIKSIRQCEQSSSKRNLPAKVAANTHNCIIQGTPSFALTSEIRNCRGYLQVCGDIFRDGSISRSQRGSIEIISGYFAFLNKPKFRAFISFIITSVWERRGVET